MSEILLLSMPYGKSYGKIDIKDLDFGVPPVGLSYIGSFLKVAGHDVRLIDLMFTTRNWEDVRNLIKDESPRWVGISATTPQINEAFITAEIVKQINPEINVVIGGVHASALPEQTISDKNIDILVYGEGEFTMLELAQDKELKEIKGIFYKRDGKIVKNPPRDLVENIDIFPYPLYEDLPIDKYGTEFFGTTLGIISSRGCPYQCTYCAANTIHKRWYRKRSTENVIGEIEKLKYDFKLKKISFYDDTFTLDNKRTVEICEAIIKSNIGLEWNCLTRSDSLTKPLLEIMKAAGCKCIQIGIESGDNEVLRLAKRKETVEDAIQSITWAKELGIEVIGLFIIGLPYDTKETIRKTIDTAKKLKIDYAQFSILVPLPGSETWDMAQERKNLEIVSFGWENFGRYGEPIIKLKDVTKEELSKYFIQAYREFYLRPAYIINRLSSIKNLYDFINLFKRSMALLKFLK
jgi:radical SAM superfamily enzyme YgiQ (UPF0313 family)